MVAAETGPEPQLYQGPHARMRSNINMRAHTSL